MAIFKKKEKEENPNACAGCGADIKAGEPKLLNGKRFCSTACMLRKR